MIFLFAKKRKNYLENTFITNSEELSIFLDQQTCELNYHGKFIGVAGKAEKNPKIGWEKLSLEKKGNCDILEKAIPGYAWKILSI